MNLSGCLTALFLGLKLTGQIDWDWVWIFSPAWVPVAFVVVLCCFAFVFSEICRRIG